MLLEVGVQVAEAAGAPYQRLFTCGIAAVVQNGVIEAASCLLPLSQSSRIDPSLGTRHRAAIGMSEESDALVVVVSEETSIISLAVGGRMIRNLDASTLRQQLTALLGPGASATPSQVMPEVAGA